MVIGDILSLSGLQETLKYGDVVEGMTQQSFSSSWGEKKKVRIFKSDRKAFKEIKHMTQPFPQKLGMDRDEMGLFCGGVSSL